MKYFASCSFGKDSLATVLLALKYKEPLDGVVFSEVMFDNERNISGEEPEHIEWIYQYAKPKLESLGCKVYILRNEDKDYLSQFNRIRKKIQPSRLGRQEIRLSSGRPLHHPADWKT